MLKLSYRYDQASVRLLVDGLPDLSAGQADNVIGIILSWRLQLVAAPEVKGEREHLEALMISLFPLYQFLFLEETQIKCCSFTISNS